MTEHYWLFNIFQSQGTGMPRGLAFGEEFPEDFMEMTRQPPSKELRQSGWQGSRDGYHPIVFSFAPVFWEDDFKGEGRLTDDGPNFRWLFFLKYPEGVSVDEGDAWFKDVFAPEICANPEVNRFISSRQLDDPRINPFQRDLRGLVRRLRRLAKAIVEKAGQLHQAGLGHVGSGARSSSPTRTSWGSSSSTGPTPTTCSSGGATSPRDELRRAREAHQRCHRPAQARPGAGLARRARAATRRSGWGSRREEQMMDVERSLEANFQTALYYQSDMVELMPPLGATLAPARLPAPRWAGHGLPAGSGWQFVDEEVMKPEEYDEFIYDPSDFIMRKYWPRAYSRLAGLAGLMPLREGQGYFAGAVRLRRLRDAGRAWRPWMRCAKPAPRRSRR